MNNIKAWFSSGTPWIWLTAGAVSISIVLVGGLLLLILIRGGAHFWPAQIIETTVQGEDGQRVRVLGEVTDSETLTLGMLKAAGRPLPDDPDVEFVTRYLFKQGNKDITGRDFVWHMETNMDEWRYPENAIMLERREWGNFYGYPVRIIENDKVVAENDALAVFAELQERLKYSNDLVARINNIERYAIGDINYKIENARLRLRKLEFRADEIAPDELARMRATIDAEIEGYTAEYNVVKAERDQLMEDIKRDKFVAETMAGREITIPLRNIVRANLPNAMGVFEKLGFYFDKLYEFIFGYPREANTEGGVFPAIFGTISMVLIMSVMVTPFGILAAIYLREYAKQGPLLKMIRISVYNLAGVPSIVFGVFGLGFFVYFLGGSIDKLFYPELAPAPVFGTPGLFWASLTLALLTLPVVIVATEEGLARIPSTIRQGSLALGATKAETLWRVVVPLAAPAMMTGLILAVARAAGEVAPLMLVGVVKLAPTLPIDG
ncbi:MAG: phosphate ABC transporter permease PstA, partial [Gammaproteobacteria bacterium]